MLLTLSMPPLETFPIGNTCFDVLISHDTFTYFSNLDSFDLAALSKISPQDLADAFGTETLFPRGSTAHGLRCRWGRRIWAARITQNW